VELEADVVVEAGRVVLLDDEDEVLLGRARRPLGRLGGLLEVALALVLVEGISSASRHEPILRVKR
jgi:hypothetical protein